jgi:FixJ family two-component response regulator
MGRQPIQSHPAEPRTIFILEDDAGLNHLLQKKLRQAGELVEGCLLGHEALERIKRLPHCLLLLDFSLPDMTGPQFIQELLAQGRSVPFVVITGQGSEEVAVEMMRLGACDYLVKDSHFLDLVTHVVRRVNRQLDQQRQLAATQNALRQSDERFRLVLQRSPVMIAHQDQNLRYTWVYNPLPDFAPVALLGCTDLEVCGEVSGGPLHALKQRLLTSGQVVREEITLQFLNREVSLDLTLEPVRDPQQNVIGINSVAVDITERRRQANEREQLLTQLKETLANVKLLNGLLPICSACRKIRDDQGYWNKVDYYLKKCSNLRPSHGLCPDCSRRHLAQAPTPPASKG